MADTPLMPLATAVWLIDNTTLTFEQIAAFCALHPLQVGGIADGDVAVGVRGIDPIAANQVTRDEIEKGEKDPAYKLKLSRPKVAIAETKRKGPRYMPVSKRQNRPDAIAWFVRHHPEVTDAQIARLLGTTKPTIQSVRDRSHWNSANIQPTDPVSLGLCTQIELDAVVRKAAAKARRDAPPADDSPKLAPTVDAPAAPEEDGEDEEKAVDMDKVFANFPGGDD